MKKLIGFVVLLFFIPLFHIQAYAKTSFTDITPSHDSWEEIQYLIERGVINGFPDGSFRPNQPVKRIQAITMLGRALNWDTTNVKAPNVKDVEKGTEAYGYIAVAVEKGIIANSTAFNPHGTLTRAQMAKMLANAFQLPKGESRNFKDVSSKHWAKTFIDQLASSGITTGYPDNTFKPENPTTRLQFSLFLARALNPEFRESSTEDHSKAVHLSEVIEYNDRLYTWCDNEWDETKMCSMNLDGSDHQIIPLPTGSLAVWNGKFYINTFDNKIVSVNSDGTGLKTIVEAKNIPEKMDPIYLSDVIITEDWIYFSVSSNHPYEGAIYKVKHDGTKLTKVHNKPNLDLTYANGELWFHEEYADGWLTKINISSGKKTSFGIHGVQFMIDDGWVYFVERSDTGDFPLYRMKLDGSNKQLIVADVNPNSDIYVKDGTVYYVKGWYHETPTLYKNSPDGKKEQKLASFDSDIHIYGIWKNHMYLLTDHGEYKIIDLTTLSVKNLVLHQYIKPEITTPNPLVERLKSIVSEPYEVVVKEGYPEILLNGQQAINVAYVEETSEVWLNMYDTSEETLKLAIDILQSYDSSIDENAIMETMKTCIAEAASQNYETESFSLIAMPPVDETDPVDLLIVAKLKQ
ncbi:S-layer family protein [Anoxybacillus vitaminiphilus]|uniref:S-layer family protein n=1 Tax=Paranoxybacillus vitaminiphilus TaxID=581036 RepID=A0A327YFT0_9BACL|nr:S-layer homology domain-containing protein [Anoxybacillus vitaminiphilus]RAK19890.1 S-layer family protein [Anoxybacillus vitaminiphilus]